MKSRKKLQKPTKYSGQDLKEIIYSHAAFFDKLIELIPARFYLPGDTSEKPWFQGLTKAQQALSKKASRENIKKARRDRLDPNKSNSTLDLLNQNLKSKSSNEDNPVPKPGGDQSVTYEELQERLHKRIELLRASRGGSNKTKDDQISKKGREDFVKKRKKEDEESVHVSKEDVSSAEAANALAFGRVRTGGEVEVGKKRRVSKAKKLEIAEKLEAAKLDPEKGKGVKEKLSWSAATSRAAGIKVHDDPKLIRKSLRKEKRQHEKSVGKWKERVENREKIVAEKQRARAENISERNQLKKKRKIEKREKKLMRAGFEGRKEGYITTDSV